MKSLLFRNALEVGWLVSNLLAARPATSTRVFSLCLRKLPPLRTGRGKESRGFKRRHFTQAKISHLGVTNAVTCSDWRDLTDAEAFTERDTWRLKAEAFDHRVVHTEL